MLIPVLLAGGLGTRLWPASRSSRPKQFLSLIDTEKSLLVETLDRLDSLDELGPVIAVGSEAHRFMIAEQMQQAGHSGPIILEPAPRGTAAAAAAAARLALEQYGEDAELLLLPTDHAVADNQAFVAALASARHATRQTLVSARVRLGRRSVGRRWAAAGGRPPCDGPCAAAASAAASSPGRSRGRTQSPGCATRRSPSPSTPLACARRTWARAAAHRVRP